MRLWMRTMLQNKWWNYYMFYGTEIKVIDAYSHILLTSQLINLYRFCILNMYVKADMKYINIVSQTNIIENVNITDLRLILRACK